eukprot:403365338
MINQQPTLNNQQPHLNSIQPPMINQQPMPQTFQSPFQFNQQIPPFYHQQQFQPSNQPFYAHPTNVPMSYYNPPQNYHLNSEMGFTSNSIHNLTINSHKPPQIFLPNEQAQNQQVTQLSNQTSNQQVQLQNVPLLNDLPTNIQQNELTTEFNVCSLDVFCTEKLFTFLNSQQNDKSDQNVNQQNQSNKPQDVNMEDEGESDLHSMLCTTGIDLLDMSLIQLFTVLSFQVFTTECSPSIPKGNNARDFVLKQNGTKQNNLMTLTREIFKLFPPQIKKLFRNKFDNLLCIPDEYLCFSKKALNHLEGEGKFPICICYDRNQQANESSNSNTLINQTAKPSQSLIDKENKPTQQVQTPFKGFSFGNYAQQPGPNIQGKSRFGVLTRSGSKNHFDSKQQAQKSAQVSSDQSKKSLPAQFDSKFGDLNAKQSSGFSFGQFNNQTVNPQFGLSGSLLNQNTNNRFSVLGNSFPVAAGNVNNSALDQTFGNADPNFNKNLNQNSGDNQSQDNKPQEEDRVVVQDEENMSDYYHPSNYSHPIHTQRR